MPSRLIACCRLPDAPRPVMGSQKDDVQCNRRIDSGLGAMRYSDSDVDQQPSDDSDASAAAPARRSKGSAKAARAKGPKMRTLNRWTPEEHDRLAYLVSKWGSEKNWAKVAEEMPGRTGKQCRERWLNHMKPGIIKCVRSSSRGPMVLMLAVGGTQAVQHAAGAAGSRS